MKWFKHYADMHEGRSINHLLDELGHTGLCFFLLQEMCAEKFDATAENLDESSATFEFHQRIVRQKLRISATNLRRLLDICAINGLLSFEFRGNTLEIKMPILLKLLDRDAKNARKTRVDSAKKTRLEEEKELEREKEQEKDKKKISSVVVETTPPATPKSNLDRDANRNVRNAYCEAYEARYGVKPALSAKFHSAIANVVKQIGEKDAVEVAKFYLNHRSSFYVQSTHSIGLMLRDCETLRTQMLTGRAITRADIRQFETQDHYQSQLERIQRGEV